MFVRGMSSNATPEVAGIWILEAGLAEVCFADSTSDLMILLFGPLPWILDKSTFDSSAVFLAMGEAKILPPAAAESGVDYGLSIEAGHDLFSSTSAFLGASVLAAEVPAE